MSNSLFAYPDYSLKSTFGLVSGSGTFEALLPVSNLTDPKLGKIARTINGCTSISFTITSAVSRVAKLLSILKHNASPTATVCFILYSDTLVGPCVYDSTILPFYPAYYPSSVLNWEDNILWTGFLTDEDLLTFKPDFWLAITPVAWKVALVDIVDTNNQSLYFELGRCSIWSGWSPKVNIVYGFTFGVVTDTLKTRSMGGSDTFDVRPIRRIATPSLESQSDDTMGFDYEMKRRLGISGELFFVFNPNETLLLHKQKSFLCRMRDLSPLDFAFFDGNNTSYQFEEVL